MIETSGGEDVTAQAVAIGVGAAVGGAILFLSGAGEIALAGAGIADLLYVGYTAGVAAVMGCGYGEGAGYFMSGGWY